MTSRERVLAALRHERADRVPVDAWFRIEVEEALRERLGCADKESLYRALGIDLRQIFPTLSRPCFRQRLREAGVSETEGHLPLEGRRHEWVWGAVFQTGADGKYDEWLDGSLTDADDLSGFTTPEEMEIIARDECRNAVAAAREFFVLGCLDNPFKIAWHLRGFEKWLMDYHLNPALVAELYDRLWATTMRFGLFMAGAGVDCLAFFGDVAMQDRMIIAPDLWRKFEKPRLADFIREIRAKHPQMYFFFHSDGDVGPIVGDLVEIGFDMLNPIQPECMDPIEVKRTHGDRLTLHGTISVQTTLPEGPPERVREEVHHRIETCGRDGGLVIGPTNMVQFDTPVENVLAMYEAALGKTFGA